MRAVALTAASILITASLPFGVLTAPQAAGTEVVRCDANTFTSRVRAVVGSVDIGISRINVHTYPGRTALTDGSRTQTNFNRKLSAGVSHTDGITLSAGATLKKVVSIFGEATSETGFAMAASTTVDESKYVTHTESVTIPGGKTVVWFVGHKTVRGAFRYSTCDPWVDTSGQGGKVSWHTGYWRSFAFRDDGGQRCDLDAVTSVAKAAKKIGCA